jgi:hypothetical protein
MHHGLPEWAQRLRRIKTGQKNDIRPETGTRKPDSANEERPGNKSLTHRRAWCSKV